MATATQSATNMNWGNWVLSGSQSQLICMIGTAENEAEVSEARAVNVETTVDEGRE